MIIWMTYGTRREANKDNSDIYQDLLQYAFSKRGWWGNGKLGYPTKSFQI